MMRLSASRLHLAALCPASFALAHHQDRDSTDAQTAGTGRHAFLSELARAFMAGDADPTAAALATIPAEADWRSTCEGINTEALLEGVVSIRFDVPYAYDVEAGTARVLEVSGHRGYEDIRPAEITGTFDWLVTRTDGSIEVIDFKGIERATLAAQNLQLALYAVAVSKVEGLEELDVALCYIGLDGYLDWDRAHLDTWDLAAKAEELAKIHAKVEDAIAEGDAVDTHPGMHCPRCPALRSCPAHVALAMSLASTAEDPEPFVQGLVQMSDEDAGRAWVTLVRAEAVLKAVRDSLRARVLSHPIPLPDGSRVVATEQNRRSLDVVKALPVLRARVGERAETYVDRSLATEVVTRLAREMAPGLGLTIAAATKLLWAELETADAVKSFAVTSCQVKVGKEKEPKKTAPKALAAPPVETQPAPALPAKEAPAPAPALPSLALVPAAPVEWRSDRCKACGGLAVVNMATKLCVGCGARAVA